MSNTNFIVKNGITVNGSFTANSTAVTASALTVNTMVSGSNVSVNTTTVFVGDGTTNTNIIAGQISLSGATVNSTIYQGTANNATNLGGTSASSYQLNSTLNANIANYLPTYSGVVNSSSFNVGSNFTGNSTTIQLGSTATSAFVANTTTISIGNSTVNTYSNSSHFFAGNSTYYGLGNNTTEGIVSPTSNLFINSTAMFIGNGTTNAIINSTSISMGSIFSILASGNVGIGTASPSYRLTVAGDIMTHRGTTSGSLFIGNSGTSYIYYDGTNYNLGGTGALLLGGSANATVFQTGGGLGVATNGVYVNTSSVYIGNSTVNTTINSTSFSGVALSANNATYLNGQLASYYTSASNITTGTLPFARLPANAVFWSNNNTYTGVQTFSANVSVVNVYSTGTINSTASQTGGGIGSTSNGFYVNATTIYVGNSTVNTTITPLAISGNTLANSAFSETFNIPGYGSYSTTARTLTTRYTERLNLKDFGAVGDGVTDDSQAVASWLYAGNQLVSNNQVVSNVTLRGKPVALYAPAGIYYLGTANTTMPTFTQKISIIGEGSHQTIFKIGSQMQGSFLQFSEAYYLSYNGSYDNSRSLTNDRAGVHVEGISIVGTAIPITFNANTSSVNSTSGFVTLQNNANNGGGTLQLNDLVFYGVPSGNTAIPGFTANNYYYVNFANSTGITISLTKGGATIVPTPSSSTREQHYFLNKTNVQHAIDFIDRNSHAELRDIEVAYLNGSAYRFGAGYTPGTTYASFVSESNFYNIRANYCGMGSFPSIANNAALEAMHPALHINGQGIGGTADGCNHLKFFGVNIFGSYGPGIKVSCATPMQGAATRTINFYGTRVELPSMDNIMIGDSTESGQLHSIMFKGVNLVTTPSGYNGININPGLSNYSGSGTFSGNNMTVTGSVGSLFPGTAITTTNIANGTYIVSQQSGTTGGDGVYTISTSNGTITTPQSVTASTPTAPYGCVFDDVRMINIYGTALNIQASQGYNYFNLVGSSANSQLSPTIVIGPTTNTITNTVKIVSNSINFSHNMIETTNVIIDSTSSSIASKALYVNANVFIYSFANGNIGIANSTPDATFKVTGTSNISGNVVIGGGLTAANVTASLFTGNVTGTVSNATNLNSQPGSYYTNASNITTGTLPYAQLGANVVNTSAAFTITGVHTHQANVIVGNASINSVFSNAQIVLNNGNTVTLNSTSLSVGNTTVNSSINTSTISFNGVSIANSTGANNAFYLGGIVASSYVNTSQLSSNLNNYAALSGATFTGSVTTTNTVTIGTAAYHVANGNFGIGTSTPAYILDGYQNSNTASYFRLYNANTGTSSSAGFNAIAGAQQIVYYTSQSAAELGSVSNIPLYTITNNTIQTTLAANGNLGIGTQTPGYKLEVNGSAKVGTGGITFSSGATQYNAGMAWLGAYSGSTAYKPNDVVFYQGATYTGMYIAKVATTGNAPTDGSTNTYWAVMLYFTTTSAGGGGGGGGEGPSG